ncbi:tryptophan--tRNA ligase [Candidatus Woesearchaeota archaeon]|nr:tryptophan--tRNA ligase [Candidatus Woesearchaeota archaeon]
MASVTPWEAKGNIDYDRLIQEFGTQPLDKTLQARLIRIAGEDHHFLRRDIFFSHRDMKWLLDEYEKGNKFFLYTGRAPSGPIHLGHLLPWLFTKWLQDKFHVRLLFQFTDEEKFLFKEGLTLTEAKHWLEDNMLDVAAIGFDPELTDFLIDTKHAGMMYPEAIKVAKRVTFSTAKAVFGMTNQTNLGAIFYTAMQAVPAFLPSIYANKKIPCFIPHGIDQDPHFRVTRDVLPKIGFDKPAAIHCRFLPGLGGMESDGKMSASDASTAIFTTDDQKTVKRKIMKYAFSGGQATTEEHRKAGGNPDVDVAYQWLTFFEEDDHKLKRYYEDYKSGKLLTGELKQILVDKINAFLKEHQARREQLKGKLDRFIIKDEAAFERYQ